ncbi:hypothetical protein U9M48_040644 [Paspalum notatum var. saurae]|uniref:Uncharacterized protein n=1 Tax=Paspalum notatum var. saurae TaxID=547442 RepID=A0AAQ3UST0_PASNO
MQTQVTTSRTTSSRGTTGTGTEAGATLKDACGGAYCVAATLIIVYADFLDLLQASPYVHRLNYGVPRICNLSTHDFEFVMEIDRNNLEIGHSYGMHRFRDISLTPYRMNTSVNDAIPPTKKKKAEELMHESSYLVLKVDDEVESFYQQFVLKNGVKKLPSFVAIGDINLSYKEFQQCFKKYVNVTEKVMEIYVIGDTPLAVDLWAQKIRQDLAWLDPDPVSAWNAGRRRGPSGSQHVAGGVGARALRSLRAGRPVAVRAGKRTADTQTEATGES